MPHWPFPTFRVKTAALQTFGGLAFYERGRTWRVKIVSSSPYLTRCAPTGVRPKQEWGRNDLIVEITIKLARAYPYRHDAFVCLPEPGGRRNVFLAIGLSCRHFWNGRNSTSRPNNKSGRSTA